MIQVQFRCFFGNVSSQIAFLLISPFFFVFFRGKFWAGWQPPGRLLGDSWVLLRLLGPPRAFWASRAYLRAFWGSPGLPGSLLKPSWGFLGPPGYSCAFIGAPGRLGSPRKPPETLQKAPRSLQKLPGRPQKALRRPRRLLKMGVLRETFQKNTKKTPKTL